MRRRSAPCVRYQRNYAAWMLKTCEGCNSLCLALSVTLALLGSFAEAQSSSVTFQSGRTLVANTGTRTYYNSSYETSITTQYIDTWNNQNGMTVRPYTPWLLKPGSQQPWQPHLLASPLPPRSTFGAALGPTTLTRWPTITLTIPRNSSVRSSVSTFCISKCVMVPAAGALRRAPNA